MSTKTVRFNVGGHKYEVSRSLLNMHPDTTLARSASEQLREEAEIFIERDGLVFRHVLSYLRDSHVSLPLTVTKSTLLQELQYYGVQLADESAIDESSARGFQLAAGVQSMKEEVQRLEEEHEKNTTQAKESEMRCVFHDFARNCVGEYVKKLSLTVRFYKNKDQAGYELAKKAQKLEGEGANTACLNTYMSKVGLKLKSLESSSMYSPNNPFIEAYLDLVNAEEDA